MKLKLEHCNAAVAKSATESVANDPAVLVNYTAKITKEDGEYIVSFPDKPNVNTCGESLEHALEMAEEALNETLMCELDFGKHLIMPKTKENSKKGLYAVLVKPEVEIAFLQTRH